MFGAGWTEMLIIGVVALVVIGPKDLPVVMAKLGRMVRTVRRMGDEFRRELDKTTGLDQITELRRSITEPLRQTSDEILREFNRQTDSGFEPSGIVKPTDPKVESVYDQIAATSGLPPKDASSAIPESEPLPAPAEAAPAATKPRRVRKAKVEAGAATPVAKPARRTARKTDVVEPAPAPVEAGAPVAPATTSAKVTPRKRAAAKPANGSAAGPDTTPSKPARASKAGAKAAVPATPETPRLPAEEA